MDRTASATRASRSQSRSRSESHFPQLQDQLASSLEFLEQSEDDADGRIAGAAAGGGESDGTRVGGTADRGDRRSPAAASSIRLGRIRRSQSPSDALIVNAAAVVTAVVRLVAPWGGTDWPRANHLAFRDPPTRLAVGQTFEVELFDRGGVTAGRRADRVPLRPRRPTRGSVGVDEPRGRRDGRPPRERPRAVRVSRRGRRR